MDSSTRRRREFTFQLSLFKAEPKIIKLLVRTEAFVSRVFQLRDARRAKIYALRGKELGREKKKGGREVERSRKTLRVYLDCKQRAILFLSCQRKS